MTAKLFGTGAVIVLLSWVWASAGRAFHLPVWQIPIVFALMVIGMGFVLASVVVGHRSRR